MFEVGARVRLQANGYGKLEGREGVITQILEAGPWPYYIEVEGVVHPYRSKEFEVIEEETVKFKAGDTVKVVGEYTAGKHMLGVTTKIAYVEEDYYHVVDPTGQGLFTSNGESTWVYEAEHLELVEKPAKKKSQQIELEDIQKGDEIVSFTTRFGVEVRRKGVVARITRDGQVETAEGANLIHNYGAYGSEIEADSIFLLHRPEPTGFDALDKAKTYFIKVKSGQTGWYLGYRRGAWLCGPKVGALRTNADRFEEWFTAGKDAWEKPVEFVEPKKPVYTDINTLDKAKHYEIKGARYLLEGVIAHINGEWQWRARGGEFVTVDEHGFDNLELVGEHECTDLEKFEAAGLIGARFRSGSGSIEYKVTKKGNVKGKFTDREDSWGSVCWSYADTKVLLDCKAFYKIS